MARNKFFDFIKGFLIIMVILGHTTAAFGSYEKDFFLNYMNGFTVSFIMPLFLITTGYFILTPGRQVDLNWFRIKFRRLLFPAVIWGACTGLALLVVKFFIERENMTLSNALQDFYNCIKTFWYLYATFISAVIIGGVERLVSSRYTCNVILIVVAILLHFIPTDIFWISFAFEFILLGYFIRKNDISVYIKRNYNAIFSVLYIVLLMFFKYDYSVYEAGSNFINNEVFFTQLNINSFRYLMGVLGSIFIVSILSIIYKLNENYNVLKRINFAIENVGNYSLEMYVTQHIVVERVFYILMNYFGDVQDFISKNSYILYFIWRNIFGVVLIFVTYNICKFIKKIGIGKYVY